MILTIELTPEQLERLKEAAHARGVEPTVLLELIIDSLPLSTEIGAVLKLGVSHLRPLHQVCPAGAGNKSGFPLRLGGT